MTYPDPPGTRRWVFAPGTRPSIPGEPVLGRALQRVMDDLDAVPPALDAEVRLGLMHVPMSEWSVLIQVGAVVVDESGFDPGPGRLRAAAGIADAVSTHLAGYDFAQWPTVRGRMLAATVRDGRCVWVDLGTQVRVAPVGGLRNVGGQPEPSGNVGGTR